jgi:cytoskeletal protein RodZ
VKKQNLHNDQAQLEKLADLGCRLKQLRQQKGLTLEQVSVRTLVPARILTAIEAGNLKQLPEPVYVQGFIRRYADAVGMNGTQLAEEFPLNSFSRPDRPIWRFNIQAQLRPLHLYMLYMGLVMSSVGGLSYLLNRPSQVVGLLEVPPKPAPLVSPGAVQVGPVPPARPKPVEGQKSSPVAVPNKSVQVGVKLTEQSWISIVADGKNEFEGVLPQGSQRTWVADKQLTVRAGNAGGVMVSFNNGKAKPLGNPGSVEEVTFGTNPQLGQLPGQPSDSTLTASNSSAF